MKIRSPVKRKEFFENKIRLRFRVPITPLRLLFTSLPSSSSARRAGSPVLEPDSPIPLQPNTQKVQCKFTSDIARHFGTPKIVGLKKSQDYNCQCLHGKRNCTCEEATLEINLRIRYHLTDPTRYRAHLGGTEQ